MKQAMSKRGKPRRTALEEAKVVVEVVESKVKAEGVVVVVNAPSSNSASKLINWDN
jgi:hypothetical protein